MEPVASTEFVTIGATSKASPGNQKNVSIKLKTFPKIVVFFRKRFPTEKIFNQNLSLLMVLQK